MARNFVYDYYYVAVPGDLADNLEELAEHAINQAREQAKLYCMPAYWSATCTNGEVDDHEVTFKVCRKRNRIAPQPTS